MDLIFVRIDEKTFQLIPTRTSSRSEDRILRRNIERLVYQQLRETLVDAWGKEVSLSHAATTIVRYAREYPTYKFWEFIDFSEQSFHYDSTDELLKKIIGKNREGVLLGVAMTEVMQKLGWKQTT